MDEMSLSSGRKSNKNDEKAIKYTDKSIKRPLPDPPYRA